MKSTPAKRVPMDSLRKTAFIGGGLYLITFISSIPAVFLEVFLSLRYKIALN